MERTGTGDAEVDAFVDESVISFAAWDLVAYLSEHSSEAHTLPEYARLLSRAQGDLEPVLRRLTDTGVIIVAPDAAGDRYRLAAEPTVRDVVSRFVSLSTRREYRLEFVRRVLGQITGAS